MILASSFTPISQGPLSLAEQLCDAASLARVGKQQEDGGNKDKPLPLKHCNQERESTEMFAVAQAALKWWASFHLFFF